MKTHHLIAAVTVVALFVLTISGLRTHSVIRQGWREHRLYLASERSQSLRDVYCSSRWQRFQPPERPRYLDQRIQLREQVITALLHQPQQPVDLPPQDCRFAGPYEVEEFYRRIVAHAGDTSPAARAPQ